MSEFLHRRHEQVKNRRPLADKITPAVTPPPGVMPTATQEMPATEVSNRREDIGTVLVQVTNRDTARRGIRFRNSGATTIYIGGAGVTNETACIRLTNGDIWEETLASAAQWWALSDAAGGILNIESIH